MADKFIVCAKNEAISYPCVIISPSFHVHDFAMLWTIMIKDLEVMASIGILPVERVTLQRLLINVECVYETGTTPTSFEEVFCYHTLITRIEDFFKIQHFDLLEPLAEKISRLCFEDKKVLETKVKLEKLDILPQTRSVGLQIIRSR